MDKAWVDVHKAEELKYAVNSKFLELLKKALKRENKQIYLVQNKRAA